MDFGVIPLHCSELSHYNAVANDSVLTGSTLIDSMSNMKKTILIMGKVMDRIKYAKSLLAIAIAASPMISMANEAVQEEDDSGIEVILVTSQLRVQSMQEVPIAIAAFDAAALKEQGLDSLEDITSVVPNVELQDARGAGQPTWVIRGAGLSDFNANNTPVAAIFYDEVYMTSNALGGIGLFDIDRIEVLKGPQGGLYGRNATGGAVRVMSTRPDLNEFEGYASASYGRWGSWGLEGAVGAPIIEDKLAFRIAMKTDQGGGWQDSLATPGDDEHGDRDFQAVRGQLLYAPTENLEILFKIDAGKDQSETVLGRANGVYATDYSFGYCDAVLAGGRDESNCIGLHNLLGNTLLPSDQKKDGSTVLSNPINELDNEWTGYNLQVEWDLGFATLKSISSYLDYDYVQYFDYDGTPLAFITSIDGFPDADTNFEQWSQEFRLTSTGSGPLTWLVGGTYAEDTNKSFQNASTQGLADFGFTPTTLIQADYKQKTETWALYGQLGYDISDSLNLNGSLRYTDEDKTIDHTSLQAEGGPLFVIGSVEGFETSLDENWSGHIGLDWRVSDNALVYAKFSRGFKSGGYFAAWTEDNDTLTPYAEEINDAYEIGLKSNPTKDVQVNASVFYYDYQDAQGVVTVESETSVSGTLNTVGTVGDAEHYGAELDVAWIPSAVPGFSLMLSAAWLDAEITDSDQVSFDLLGNLASLEGLDREHSPTYSYSVNIRQEKNLTDSLLGSISAVYSWRDDVAPRSTRLSDVDCAVYCQESYGLLNLRIALADLDQGWEVALLGENVTGEEYVANATGDDAGSFMDMPARPASWKVQLRYDF